MAGQPIKSIARGDIQEALQGVTVCLCVAFSKSTKMDLANIYCFMCQDE